VLEIEDLGFGVEDLQLEIYDMFGKLVLKFPILNCKTLIKKGDLANGVYILNVKGSNRIYSAQLLVKY